MEQKNVARNRAALTPFLSAAALEPTRRPLKTLWLGEMSSTLDGMAQRYEPTVAADMGKPARLTMFRLLEYMETSFPRHVPWTMFPVISEPFYEFKAVLGRNGHDHDIFPKPGDGLTEVADIFDRFEAFIAYASPSNPLEINEDLTRLSYALSCFTKPNQPVFVRALGWEPPIMESNVYSGTVYWSNTRELRYVETRVEEIMDRVRPYGLLMYSYRLNFAAIAMKALRAARFEAERPAIIAHLEAFRNSDKKSTFVSNPVHPEVATFRKPKHKCDSQHYWRIFRGVERGWARFEEGLVPQGLDHPFTLQMLYMLERAGSVSCEEFLNSWDGSHHLLGEVLSRGNGSRMRQKWLGTGKYPAISFPVNDKLQRSLLSVGLIEIDHDNLTVSISEVGRKFLSYLHPSCEDPDVVVRWIDENEQFFRVGTEASIEEWLTKFFRKMKTKVNLIPEHLTQYRGRGPFSMKSVDDDWD